MYKLKPIVACEYVIPSTIINVSNSKKIVSLANLMDIARYFKRRERRVRAIRRRKGKL